MSSNIIQLPHFPHYFEDTNKIVDSLVARTANVFRGSLKEKIFYMHIHKCAGVSITKAIKSCYRTLDISQDRRVFHLNANAAFNAVQKLVNQAETSIDPTYEIEMSFREKLLLYYMCQQHIDFIAGHFRFSETAHQHFSDKFAFVTVLRNPVDRWISFYFYNRYKQGGHRKLDIDITEYLQSERGQKLGHSYVRWLSDFDTIEDFNLIQASNKAKSNLDKFAIVGCLDYAEDFVKQFEERFGRKIKIGFSNRSPKSKAYQNSVITEELKEKIRAICQPDIEIYQYAVNKFVNRQK